MSTPEQKDAQSRDHASPPLDYVGLSHYPSVPQHPPNRPFLTPSTPVGADPPVDTPGRTGLARRAGGHVREEEIRGPAGLFGDGTRWTQRCRFLCIIAAGGIRATLGVDGSNIVAAKADAALSKAEQIVAIGQAGALRGPLARGTRSRSVSSLSFSYGKRLRNDIRTRVCRYMH